jgi:hypothetical protein
LAGVAVLNIRTRSPTVNAEEAEVTLTVKVFVVPLLAIVWLVVDVSAVYPTPVVP